MASPGARSLLQENGIARGGFNMREVSDMGFIDLQVFHRKPGLLESVATALGIILPESGEVVASGDREFYWSAPGEWLIAVPGGSEREQLGILQSRLEGLFVALTVTTDSRFVIQLSGPRVQDVLARGSSVDLHPAVFMRGRCLRTRMASVPVMLAHGSEPGSYLLFACRSVACYLFEWFNASSTDC